MQRPYIDPNLRGTALNKALFSACLGVAVACTVLSIPIFAHMYNHADRWKAAGQWVEDWDKKHFTFKAMKEDTEGHATDDPLYPWLVEVERDPEDVKVGRVDPPDLSKISRERRK